MTLALNKMSVSFKKASLLGNSISSKVTSISISKCIIVVDKH